MATISRKGFGQVEPNHLSAQKTGQIYAQLPAKNDIERLENGQFVKYDYANGLVNFSGEGEWMMIFNEIKLYDDRWREYYKDYCMKREDCNKSAAFPNGEMTPRVIKTNVGDIYTTNCVGAGNTDGKKDYAGIDLVVGDKLTPDANGFLNKVAAGATPDMIWKVVKVYTMPDAQPGVKLQRIK